MRIIQFFILYFLGISTGNSIVLANKTYIDSLMYNYHIKNELNDSMYFNLLYNLSFYYVDKSPDSSLIYSQELIEKAELLENHSARYNGYVQKGNALKLKGNFNMALSNYIKSANIAKLKLSKKKLGVVYSLFGDVYSLSKNHNNSILYYNKSIEILRSDNDSITLAIVLLNTGSEYLDSKILDQALDYFNEAANIFNAFNYQVGKGYCLGNIGNILLQNKDYVEAEKYLHNAIDILQIEKDIYSVGIYKRYLAEIYLNQRNFNQAINIANESLDLASGSGLRAQIRDASKLLSQIYDELGDYKNAYHYQCQYIAYRDSINNEETIRKMADLRTEYEVAQKQIEVEKAETQLDLETKRRQTQQIVGIGLLVVLFLTGALAYVLFRNAKRTRYINKLLREQKEEMRTQRDMLEDVNNTKDRFFSIISHDLRGPIGVLNGTTMLIREYLDSKEYSQLEELTTNMEYSVKKVQNLLDNLLEWALSQRGQYNYVAEKVELNKAMLDTISVFSEMALAKNIELSYEQRYAEAIISVDRNSLTTILRNLINNALKFTKKGGTIDLIVEKDPNNTLIKVRDTGVGIPEEKINTLFNIEAKKSTWGTDREKGLGIGLNLVSEFVKMNKGTIEVQSEIGVGTTFIIKFPTTEVIADLEKTQFI